MLYNKDKYPPMFLPVVQITPKGFSYHQQSVIPLNLVGKTRDEADALFILAGGFNFVDQILEDLSLNKARYKISVAIEPVRSLVRRLKKEKEAWAE